VLAGGVMAVSGKWKGLCVATGWIKKIGVMRIK